MNKTILSIIGSLLLMTAPAFAATSAQTDKMKSCAAEYHTQNIAKSEYKTFMAKCLKKDSPVVANDNQKPTEQKAKMTWCQKEMKTEGLTGQDRKTALAACLKK